MEKLKSSITNMVLVLTGIAIIMGCILAWVNHVTEGPIAQQKEKTLAEGIKAVMGGGDLNVAKTDTVPGNVNGKDATFVVYQTEDAAGKPLGAAVESSTMGMSICRARSMPSVTAGETSSASNQPTGT
mgnify:CR=1 FL=1